MNTKILSIVVLCGLALSACSEESPTASNTQPVPLPPAPNPLEVVTNTDSPIAPVTPMPDAQPPIQTVPDNTSPIPGNLPPPITVPTPLPVDDQPLPPTVGNPTPTNPQGIPLTAAQLVNGTAVSTAQTFWRCEVVGNTNSDDYLQLVFLTDQSAQVSSGSDTVLVNWDVAGSTIFMSTPASAGSIEFSSTVFATEAQFSATLSFTGSPSAPVVCDQFAVGGAPVNGGDSDPGFSGSQGTLLNTVSISGPEDFWGCQLQSGEQVYLVFLDRGIGVLVSDDFPEGIQMSWGETSQGVTITLDDGNQVLLTSPRFESTEYFFVSNVVVNGSDNGFMDCELLLF